MIPANKPFSKAGLLLVVLMVGPALYWGFTYTGPYRYLAELQLKWFGVYYPELTGIVIAFGILCLLAVVKVLFRGAERHVPALSAPTANPTTPLSAATASPAEQRWARWLPYFVVPILFAVGANAYYKGMNAGSLRQLSAAEFYGQNEQPRVFYADVRGQLSLKYLSKDNYFYLPMTAEDNSGAPLRLVVGGNKRELQKAVHRDADGAVHVWGVVDKGLEGDVKYAFEKNGYHLSDTIWVLHAGRAPSDEKGLGLFMMGFGVAAAGVVFLAQKIKDRKRARSKPSKAAA